MGECEAVGKVRRKMALQGRREEGGHVAERNMGEKHGSRKRAEKGGPSMTTQSGVTGRGWASMQGQRGSPSRGGSQLIMTSQWESRTTMTSAVTFLAPSCRAVMRPRRSGRRTTCAIGTCSASHVSSGSFRNAAGRGRRPIGGAKDIEGEGGCTRGSRLTVGKEGRESLVFGASCRRLIVKSAFL